MGVAIIWAKKAGKVNRMCVALMGRWQSDQPMCHALTQSISSAKRENAGATKNFCTLKNSTVFVPSSNIVYGTN
jgi:hypothetical protein